MLRFIKMRGALDQSLVIGYLIGRYDGVVNGEVTPLFGISAATFSKYIPSGGSYEVIGYEQAYYTDLKSGEALERLVNPYTGKSVEVPVVQGRPERTFISPDLRFRPSPLPPAGVGLEQWVSPPELVNRKIQYVERLNATSAGQHGERTFRYSETSTLTASMADLNNPALAHAPCEISFYVVVTWRPWLQMGDAPGEMIGTGVGEYGTTIGALPPSWLKATARHRPGILTNPSAPLDEMIG